MKYFVVTFLFLLSVQAQALSLWCNDDADTYAVDEMSIRDNLRLEEVAEKIRENARRDTQLLIYGLEKMSKQSNLTRWIDPEEEELAGQQALSLWAGILEQGLWTPIDIERYSKLDQKGIGILCWKFYVEPSFYLSTLMETPEYQEIVQDFYFNYYLRHNSYVEISYRSFFGVESELLGQKTKLITLPEGEVLNEAQQRLALEQGKARRRNFETTLKTLAGVGSAVGHWSVFSLTSKVISLGVQSAKGLWGVISKLGLIKRHAWINTIVTSKLTWYSTGGLIVGSYMYLIKIEEDIVDSLSESREMILDPELLRMEHYDLVIQNTMRAYRDFMRMHDLKSKNDLSVSDREELLSLEKSNQKKFAELAPKIELLQEISTILELSDMNTYSTDDKALKIKIDRMIDYLNQYIELMAD